MSRKYWTGTESVTESDPKVLHEWGNFRLLDNEQVECCSGVLRAGRGQWRPIMPGEWRGVVVELARLHGWVMALRTGDCWCQMGIDNPMARGHSDLCADIMYGLLLQACPPGYGQPIATTPDTEETEEEEEE